MANPNPPSTVIKRLPRYYRFLQRLSEKGVVRVSSGELSEKMGLSASQIRQDLNCFGGFGQQGYGYNVNMLKDEIAALQIPFSRAGFDLIGIFDNKESVTGQIINGMPVRNVSTLEEFCHERKPDVAILCLPTSAVAPIAEQLVQMGIKGFWNFTHYDLAIKYPNIVVENVHLTDSLMTFCYNVKHKD